MKRPSLKLLIPYPSLSKKRKAERRRKFPLVLLRYRNNKKNSERDRQNKLVWIKKPRRPKKRPSVVKKKRSKSVQRPVS